MWRIQRGPMGPWPHQSHDRLKKSCRRDSVFRRCRVFAARKIMFSVLFCSNSRPFEWAKSVWHVRLGRRTGGLDLDVLQSRSKYVDGPENAPKYPFRCPKMRKKLWEGQHRLSKPHFQTLSALSAPAAALFLRFRRPTPSKSKSCIRPTPHVRNSYQFVS